MIKGAIISNCSVICKFYFNFTKEFCLEFLLLLFFVKSFCLSIILRRIVSSVKFELNVLQWGNLHLIAIGPIVRVILLMGPCGTVQIWHVVVGDVVGGWVCHVVEWIGGGHWTTLKTFTVRLRFAVTFERKFQIVHHFFTYCILNAKIVL